MTDQTVNPADTPQNGTPDSSPLQDEAPVASSPDCLSRGAARRLALIEAATESFLSHGYGETTLDMVIAKAGGSRRTLYDHFGGKEGLFEAVISSHCERICRLHNTFEDAGRPIDDALRAFGRTLLRNFTSPDTMRLYRLVIGETNRFPEIGAMAYRLGPRRGYERMVTYLTAAHRDGRLAVPAPERSARRLLDVLRSDFYLRGLLNPETPASEAEIDAHVDQVIDEFLQDHRL